jgi:mono/diheme cytochrome c family protein
MKRVFVWLPVACLLAGCSQAPETSPETSAQTLEAGHKVYTANCAACHQVDGYGVENMQPALVNDDIVAGDPQVLVRVLLKGPAAVLPAGRPHYSNTMPQFSHLTDEQIANVLTFIRHDYGNQASPIDTQQVQIIRAQSGG